MDALEHDVQVLCDPALVEPPHELDPVIGLQAKYRAAVAVAVIGRLVEPLSRHPRHAGLAALGCGFLAGHAEVAVVVAAGTAAIVTTLWRRAPPLAVLALTALVPAGALAGSLRLESIDRSVLAARAGGMSSWPDT